MAAHRRTSEAVRAGTGSRLVRALLALPLAASLLAGCLSTVMAAGPIPARPAAAEPRSLKLATATLGGTYLPLGLALSALFGVKLDGGKGFTVTPVATAGSVENMRMLADGRADLAIVDAQALEATTGATASLNRAPGYGGPAVIARLWPDLVHFVIRRRDAKTGTIADLAALKGRRASIGLVGSGTLEAIGAVFRGLGLDPDRDFRLVELGFGASALALAQGDVDILAVTGGPPVPAVSWLMEAAPGGFALLAFPPDSLARFAGPGALWRPAAIPPGTYADQLQPVATLAEGNFLVARPGLSDDDAYLLAKVISENLGFLQSVHPATRAMRREDAPADPPLPLHPGAARYYREAGVTGGK